MTFAAHKNRKHIPHLATDCKCAVPQRNTNADNSVISVTDTEHTDDNSVLTFGETLQNVVVKRLGL